MTFPSGSGTVVNNYGPTTPNPGTVGIAPPFGAPGTSANVAQTVPSPATYNFSNSITSTQESLNGVGPNIAQQGPVAITNSSSVLLAGVAVSGFTFFTGITKG